MARRKDPATKSAATKSAFSKKAPVKALTRKTPKHKASGKKASEKRRPVIKTPGKKSLAIKRPPTSRKSLEAADSRSDEEDTEIERSRGSSDTEEHIDDLRRNRQYPEKKKQNPLKPRHAGVAARNLPSKDSAKQRQFTKLVKQYWHNGKITWGNTDFERTEGGKLDSGYKINEHGAIVEKIATKRLEAKEFDFTGADVVHARFPPQEGAVAERIVQLKWFINENMIAKSQMWNVLAVIRCYEEQGEIKALENDGGEHGEMDEAAVETYWYKGEQIPVFKALTMKTDNEVWTEDRVLRVCFRGAKETALGGVVGPALGYPGSNGMWEAWGNESAPNIISKAPSKPAALPGGGLSKPRPLFGDTKQDLKDGAAPTVQATAAPGLTIDFERAVIQYPPRPSDNLIPIFVALRYPPSLSTVAGTDDFGKPPVRMPRAFVAEMTYDTANSFPCVNQWVVEELNKRQTYHGPRRPVQNLMPNGQFAAEQEVQLQFCLTYHGHAVTRWQQCRFHIPPQARGPWEPQGGYANRNLTSWPINNACHFLIPKGKGTLLSWMNWNTISEQVNAGHVRLV